MQLKRKAKFKKINQHDKLFWMGEKEIVDLRNAQRFLFEQEKNENHCSSRVRPPLLGFIKINSKWFLFN